MTTLGVQGKIFKMGLFLKEEKKRRKMAMFAQPSKTSKMLKNHEVSNKKFKTVPPTTF